MRKQLFHYIEFTRSERYGSILLTFLCTGAFLAPTIYRVLQTERKTDYSLFLNEVQAFQTALANDANQTIHTAGTATAFPFDPNTATFDDFVRLGLTEKVSNIILNYRDKGGKFFDADDFKKIYSLPAADFERLHDFIEIDRPANKRFADKPNENKQAFVGFPFDPNTATEADFRKLGLSEKTTNILLNYRNKGGKYRTKADLQKIYSLSPQDFARIEPFINIAAPIAAASDASAPRPVQYAQAQGAYPKAKTVANLSIDINKATLDDWQQLPGIGATRADKIVYFREKLGGYASIAQVAEARGLPDSVFQQIKTMLVAHTPVFRKINMNTASIEEFDLHPYFDKKQASLIVAYRDQHGKYKSPDDLVKIGVFKDPAWLEKVKPYLAAE